MKPTLHVILQLLITLFSATLTFVCLFVLYSCTEEIVDVILYIYEGGNIVIFLDLCILRRPFVLYISCNLTYFLSFGNVWKFWASLVYVSNIPASFFIFMISL